jgi:hypothetical protein
MDDSSSTGMTYSEFLKKHSVDPKILEAHAELVRKKMEVKKDTDQDQDTDPNHTGKSV